jgi:acyl-coenzyme A synthetase/AMP-(fatty) acid ligase
VRDGARWVRTGDRAVRTNGGFALAGRADGTVDVAGERIDPTALERALVATPGIRQAAVLAVADAAAGTRLYAFYAGDAAQAPRHPARLVQLESLPHEAGGAVDREALRRMATAE